jgi:hypothetical protein
MKCKLFPCIVGNIWQNEKLSLKVDLCYIDRVTNLTSHHMK